MAVILDGVVTVPTGGWDLTIQLAGDPLRSATIPAGQYLYTDLVDEVEAQIQASGAEHAGVTVAISAATKLVTIRPDPAAAALTTITWSDTILRDWLGFTGATTTVTAGGSTAASYPPAGYLYLVHEATDDLELPEELRTEAYSDTTQYTVTYGRRLWRRVRLRYEGAPRSGIVDEYLRVALFWRYVMAAGVPFRYYPRGDTVTAAYDALTAPYGYQWYTHASPRDLAPSLLVPGWYAHWLLECRWHPSAGI